jgi:acetyl esterase/lipase
MRFGLLLGLALLAAASAAAAGERIAYGSAPSQFGELWLPAHADSPAPVVVMIHGGCWQLPFGRELMDGLAEDLTRHGAAVWNIEYRRLREPGGGYPGTFLDVAHAVDALRTLAAKHRLDLKHVVAVGHSAGGQLALWAAARGHLPKDSALLTPDPLRIGGVVSLSGVDDLAAYRDSGARGCGGPATIDMLTGAGRRPDKIRYADTSPRALLPIGVPQVIIAGAKDDIVPPRFARDYAAAAAKAGDKAQYVEIPDSDHFDLIDPRKPAWTEERAKILALLH